jgi:hypothetical protein
MEGTVMSASEARVSGDLAPRRPDRQAKPRSAPDLVRLIDKQGNPEKLMREHKPDGKGRCPTCRSLGCTLFAAAVAALKLREGGSTA